MVVLVTGKNLVAIGAEDVLGINSTKKEHRIFYRSALAATSNVKSTGKVTDSQTASIDCASLSLCGKYLVVCCNKNVSLWKTDTWSVVSVRDLARVSNSVKFTPSGRHLVVADRSGDAYVYSVEAPEQPGVLLLGHTSMLIDILVTASEEFVITCDRDEKIRVSDFPRAYNIHAFCLGHEKFVSCIAELPHDVSVLVSGSGDGTVRFWDFYSGTEVFLVADDFARNPPLRDQQERLENAGQRESCVEGESPPIRCFTWFKKDTDSSLGCVCVGGTLHCFVFCATGRVAALTVSVIQKISLRSEPWIASFAENGVLWVLQQVEGETACAFTLNTATNRFEENGDLDDGSEYVRSTINSKWELFSGQDAPKVLSILYKRLFDDVQEYHDRKKVRLLSTNKKLCNAPVGNV